MIEWRVEKTLGNETLFHVLEYEDGVWRRYITTALDEALARRIALACNAHDDLLKALADLVKIDYQDSLGDRDKTATDEWRDQTWDNARAAIAKAQGKETNRG